MDSWAVDPRSVAIVGMACRLPGATEPHGLWSLLQEGGDATSATPPDRYDVDAFFSPQQAPGKITSKRAGYLEDIASFDAEFFGMSASAATELDPQQRLLLMTAWEAFEDAGQAPDALAGTRTGVYVGNARADHLENSFRRGAETVTASQYNNVRSMLSARLSHFFDLRGPSIVIDTACSSALVAVHQAVQSLRAGETRLAVAASANLPMRPDEGLIMTQSGSMSSDGRSKFGDANADGHAPSDAVAVVVLKPLSHAIADGDRIRGVIAGSAVSNDGHSSESLLNPSLTGQLEVLRWAYEDAGISPSDVDFVEAHGAGSPLLDPLELQALARVLCPGREPDRPLLVGSVKSNIGHAEATGGLAGLIKAVLCLEHGQVPASLHAKDPHPSIDWDALPMEIPEKTHDLIGHDRPLLAGVTAQGSATLNAHIVLRGVTPDEQPAPVARRDSPCLLTLSARSPEALQSLRERYVVYLGSAASESGYTVGDICFSAAVHRQHHPYRLAVTGSTHAELITALGVGESIAADWQDIADRYLAGENIDFASVFEGTGRYVELPTYPWQTKRYWHGDDNSTNDDLADWILRQHARVEFQADSMLADIGIDSLGKLQLIVELQKNTGREVDPEVLDELRTVGELRQWVQGLEATAHA